MNRRKLLGTWMSVGCVVVGLMIFSGLCCADTASPLGKGNAKVDSQRRESLLTSNQELPIAVWLQDPRNAARYRDAGINLYVGLWKGPTTNQLLQLEKAGMKLVCAQNTVGLQNRDNPVIVGWMHGDEPDNAQSLPGGKGYGPPIPAERIIQDYHRLRAEDPSRPVLLNLGQGVAWDNWIGRGVRRNHPEDYPEYVKGGDIISFDIYPAVHDSPEVAGKLEFVGKGVERLMNWTRGEKVVWSCIEASRVSNVQVKPAPEQIRAEVWMALIQGAKGLIYFVHQFKPTFKEASLLDDPELLPAITALNREVQQLAPVLLGPSLNQGVRVETGAEEGTVAWMLKKHAGKTYLFTVNQRNHSARAEFVLSDISSSGKVRELGRPDTLEIKSGKFSVDFKPYEVHLYEIGTKL